MLSFIGFVLTFFPQPTTMFSTFLFETLFGLPFSPGITSQSQLLFSLVSHLFFLTSYFIVLLFIINPKRADCFIYAYGQLPSSKCWQCVYHNLSFRKCLLSACYVLGTQGTTGKKVIKESPCPVVGSLSPSDWIEHLLYKMA